jgi:hypothetical protein
VLGLLEAGKREGICERVEKIVEAGKREGICE